MPGLGSGLDGVAGAFLSREIDVDICGSAGGIGRVGSVNEDGDRGLEDALAELGYIT